MTNFEKHIGDLIQLVIENPDKVLSPVIGVYDGTPYLCEKLPCDSCEFHDSWLECQDLAMRWLHEETEGSIKETFLNSFLTPWE